jgi:hypothetical protein
VKLFPTAQQSEHDNNHDDDDNHSDQELHASEHKRPRRLFSAFAASRLDIATKKWCPTEGQQGFPVRVGERRQQAEALKYTPKLQVNGNVSRGPDRARGISPRGDWL